MPPVLFLPYLFRCLSLFSMGKESQPGIDWRFKLDMELEHSEGGKQFTAININAITGERQNFLDLTNTAPVCLMFT